MTIWIHQFSTMIYKLLISLSFLIILIFSLWNIIELRSIKKRLAESKFKFEDSYYFDLNAKIKSIVAIGSIIIFIIGFLGWNSFDNINSDIKNRIISTDSLSIAINNVSNEVENISSFIETFNEVEKKDLKRTVSNTKNEIKSLSNEIEDLSNQINTIPRNLELIKDLSISMKRYGPITKESKRFYFNEMTTYKGNKLPLFKEIPTILIFNDKGLNTLITEATTEFFDLQVLSSWECSECRFDLLIFY